MFSISCLHLSPMFSPQASACRAETATTPPFSGPPCCSCYCPGLLGSSHLKLTFFVYTLNFFTLFYLENHSCLTASLPMLNSSFLHIFSGLFEGKTDLNCKTLIICRKCSDFCLDFFTRETAWLLWCAGCRGPLFPAHWGLVISAAQEACVFVSQRLVLIEVWLKAPVRTRAALILSLQL